MKTRLFLIRCSGCCNFKLLPAQDSCFHFDNFCISLNRLVLSTLIQTPDRKYQCDSFLKVGSYIVYRVCIRAPRLNPEEPHNERLY